MQHDLAAALIAAETDRRTRPSRVADIFGMQLQLTDLPELRGWIDAAGLRVEAELGMRVVSDHLFGADDLKASDNGYRQLLELELALSDRDPYRQIGSMLHVIGRRTLPN